MGSKNRKSKGGVSKVKTKNIKGGKLGSGSKTKNKTITLARRNLKRRALAKLHQKKKPLEIHEINSDDVLDMIDDPDLLHLKTASFKDRQFIVRDERERLGMGKKGEKRNKEAKEEEEEVEGKYEKKLKRLEDSERNYKMMLPLKTKKGLQFQVVEEEEEEKEGMNGNGTEAQEEEAPPASEDEEEDQMKNAVVSYGKLVAQRRASLLQYKLRIGTLAAGFLEDPQNRMKNLDALLMIMEGTDPGVSCTVPKLCAISLLAVFKDVLPAYAIKKINPEGVKLKKETFSLQNYEFGLLSKYQLYLKKLENLVTKFCPKRRPPKPFSEAEESLGVVAFECMSGMLLSHPYFNMATNLSNFLIPYLNNWNPLRRLTAFNTVRSLFRIDKRGEISYEIVRRINDLIKTKLQGKGSKVVHPEVLNVLLSLRIKEVDLRKEKDEETAPAKKFSYEQRRKLSKNQRKKSKELLQLEKELLEVAAEENKEKKSKFLTEITKLVFTIYFRVLKMETRSKILSCVLEGLSKFAHVINIEFFDDILKVLDRLLYDGNLRPRQALLCVSTVLAVLDGQGSALTLDPTSFHKQLYKCLFTLSCCNTDNNVTVALRCIRLSLGKRKMPGPRAIAFAKRLATVALQLEFHDSAATLMELKQVLRLHPSVNTLLDCDGSGACGVYLPELDDPDHSCANAATMWELTSLSNHYHPWVSQTARSMTSPNEKVPHELANLQAEAVPEKYDPKGMEFHPPCKEPTNVQVAKPRHYNFVPKTDFFKSVNDALGVEEIDTVNFAS